MTAIQKNYEPPKDVETVSAKQQKTDAMDSAAKRAAEAERKRKAQYAPRRAADRAPTEAYWNTLSWVTGSRSKQKPRRAPHRSSGSR